MWQSWGHSHVIVVEDTCCATGQIVCVDTLQRLASSGWLPGPSDLVWPALLSVSDREASARMTGCSATRPAGRLEGCLERCKAGWVNGQLAIQVGRSLASWLPGLLPQSLLLGQAEPGLVPLVHSNIRQPHSAKLNGWKYGKKIAKEGDWCKLNTRAWN